MIYQIYYKESQLQYIKSPAIPYFNSDKEYEFGVFYKEYQSIQTGYTGYLSWRFEEKTGLTIQKFLDKIDNKYDCYAYNRFPDMLRFKNVWEQGQAYHSLMYEILDYYGMNFKDQVNDKTNTLYCNYWIANQNFWNEYISFCEPYYKKLIDEDGKYYSILFANYPFGYFPYIMERMWSTFVLNTNLTYKVFGNE